MPDPTGSPALSAEELDELIERWNWHATHAGGDSCYAENVAIMDALTDVPRLLETLGDANKAASTQADFFRRQRDAALADAARERSRADDVTIRWQLLQNETLRLNREILETRVAEQNLNQAGQLLGAALQKVIRDAGQLKGERDQLAARVVSLEEACRRAIGAYDNDKNLDHDRYQLRLEREMENLTVVLRGASEKGASDG